MIRSRFVSASLAALLVLGHVIPAAAMDVYHHVLKTGERPAPGKVLVLKPDIFIYEVTAGGVVEKLAQSTDDAVKRFEASLRKYAEQHAVPVEVVPMPELTADEKTAVAEFVAQYTAVSAAARAALSGGKEWSHKVEKFDYSVGFGLEFLKAKSGAEVVLVSAGSAMKESTGRSAMNLAGAIAVAFLSGGTYVPMRSDEQADIAMALVDIQTGDILWTKTEVVMPNVLDSDDANYDFVSGAIKNYFDGLKKK